MGLIPNLLSNDCDIVGCNGKPEVYCIECDMVVCKKHARKDKCIYCTKEGIEINKEFVKKVEKVIEENKEVFGG